MAADLAVFGNMPGCEHLSPRDLVPLHHRIMSAAGRRAVQQVIILSSQNVRKKDDMEDLFKRLLGNQEGPFSKAPATDVKKLEGGFNNPAMRGFQDLVRAELAKKVAAAAAAAEAKAGEALPGPPAS